MVATDPVVVACSIIMELCIFAAGATAISGAGALAFGAMVFITLYVLFWIGGPIIIFDKWSYMLVFWIFVPFRKLRGNFGCSIRQSAARRIIYRMF